MSIFPPKGMFPVILWSLTLAGILPATAASESPASSPFCGKKPAAETREMPISEASGIAALPNGSFLVADDGKGLILLRPDRTTKTLIKAKDETCLWDLEGICLSTDGKSVYCLSEREGAITRIPLELDTVSVKPGKTEKLGNLPELGVKANKGWEGICTYWDKGRDFLLAVHQAHPHALGLFVLPSLEPLAIRKLPDEMKDLIGNLSDLTIDRRTGHLLLLGAQTQTILEIQALDGSNLMKPQLMGRRNLPLDPDDRPEGMCFDPSDHLVIVTDGGGGPGKFLNLP